MGNGNAYNRLNSFLLSLLVWLEDGQRLLVRNASFHCSRTVQLVPIFSRVHISYDCTRALYGSPTHVSANRVSRHPVYTAARLNGRGWLGWKKRILCGQIAVAFARNRCEIYLLFDGVEKKVRGLNWLSVGRGRIVWKITSIQSVCYIIYKINI